MISITVKQEDSRHISCRCECNYHGDMGGAIQEFETALQALKKADKVCFRLALANIVEEEIEELHNDCDD